MLFFIGDLLAEVDEPAGTDEDAIGQVPPFEPEEETATQGQAHAAQDEDAELEPVEPALGPTSEGEVEAVRGGPDEAAHDAGCAQQEGQRVQEQPDDDGGGGSLELGGGVTEFAEQGAELGVVGFWRGGG